MGLREEGEQLVAQKERALARQLAYEKLALKMSMFNVVNELKEGAIMSSSKIKEYTGGNYIEARALHSNKLEKFQCRGQIYIDTNTLGTFDEVDQPLRDRLEVLHFPYRYIRRDNPDYDPDNPYQKLLIENVLENILNCEAKMMNLMLHYHGLDKPLMPQSIILAKNNLISSIDDVEQFIARCSKGVNSEFKEMYQEYRGGGGELGMKQFKTRMKNKGYEYKKVRLGEHTTVYGFHGIHLGTSSCEMSFSE